MQEPDSGVWMWIAGGLLGLWSALHSMIIGWLYVKGEKNAKDLSDSQMALAKSIADLAVKVTDDREDKCVPRAECERTHEAGDVRVEGIEGTMKENFKAVFEKLDYLIKEAGKK